jgi:hypothetical protein
MTDDAIGGLPDVAPIMGVREYTITGVVNQLDRIEGTLSRIEGHAMGHNTALQTVNGLLAQIAANVKWTVDTVTGLMQVASTLPGVGGMMGRIKGNG